MKALIYTSSMNLHSVESLWDHLVGMSAEALRMTEAEINRFRANRVAKLIGLLPFIANCNDSGRTALAHLGTFVIANRGEARRVFDHKPADDSAPLARLWAISGFKGGDRAVIDRGMALLGLCMVSGYQRDAERDRLLDEYNPLVSGAWKGDATEQAFRSTLEATAAGAADLILSADDAIVTFWQT